MQRWVTTSLIFTTSHHPSIVTNRANSVLNKENIHVSWTPPVGSGGSYVSGPSPLLNHSQGKRGSMHNKLWNKASTNRNHVQKVIHSHRLMVPKCPPKGSQEQGHLVTWLRCLSTTRSPDSRSEKRGSHMSLSWSVDHLETRVPCGLMGLSPSGFRRFPKDVMSYLEVS